MRALLFLYFVISLTSCTSPEKTKSIGEKSSVIASGFKIENFENFKIITLNNPWQKYDGQGIRYILTDNPHNLPDSLLQETIIKIPVQTTITFSTTHVGFISALDKNSGIVGVSGKDFISNPELRKSIDSGTCFDVGFAPNIDYERILMLKPDMVFLYGLDPSVTAIVKRLKDAGIQSVLVSEFLEPEALGKAEWIRFFAAFLDCGSKADSIFNVVESNYQESRKIASQFKTKPKILVGLPFKDTWFMAGGKSFTARLIEDAGGEYLWNDNSNTDFIPLDLESVFQKAGNADIWINSGTAQTIQEILSYDKRLEYIPALKNGKIFNNNLKVNEFGGNDFWESGAVRPDYILDDLIHIFHHNDSENYVFNYYKIIR